MIIDSLPEVKGLSPEEKWQLAEELWGELMPREIEARDHAIELLVNERMEHYHANPETAISWEGLRQKLDDSAPDYLISPV
jgi:putative addiction module component (TIGR02574 family)